MRIVYIGIGSNLGDRRANCELALFLLRKKGVRIAGVSPFYNNEAVIRRPDEAAPPYLNAAARIETDLDPEALLNLLEEIERLVGRRSKGDWAPRPIDLDILFYGDLVLDTPRLKIPHPEAARRWFILKPLLDIAPDFVHPVLGKTVKEVFDAALH